MSELYRVGRHQPQNVYRGEQYIGVMFSPIDAAAFVSTMNSFRVGSCDCESNEPCQGQCCGVGMCSCSPPPERPAEAPTLIDGDGDSYTWHSPGIYRMVGGTGAYWTRDELPEPVREVWS